MSDNTSNDASMDAMREALEQRAQACCTFLVTDAGFARGPAERSASAAVYSYKNRHQTGQLGVQALLDFRQGLVDLCVVRLHSGRLPKLGQTESDGRIVRVSLIPLLRDVLLVRDERVNRAAERARTKPPWDGEFAAQVLDMYHDLLRRYLDLLQQQPLDVLFPPTGRPRS